MTDRDKDWFDTDPSPQDRTDDFILVHQLLPGSALICGRFVLPNQSALGDTYGGYLAQNTQVAGNAKAPRMCPPLPITEQKVGQAGQSVESIQHGRNLAK
jgi:hypothetical protein